MSTTWRYDDDHAMFLSSDFMHDVALTLTGDFGNSLQRRGAVDAILKMLNGRDEAVERDAARYRWLRDIHNQGAKVPQGTGPLVVSDRPDMEPRYLGPLSGDALDKAVDDALSRSEER